MFVSTCHLEVIIISRNVITKFKWLEVDEAKVNDLLFTFN